MVRGVGVDIVDIDRIERLVERYGDAFVKRVFTAAEAAYCVSMARPAVHFAGRFAVKEALYKALPACCQACSRWRSIETISDGGGGRPRIAVLDQELAAAMRESGVSTVHVSISHERQTCVAMVVLE